MALGQNIYSQTYSESRGLPISRVDGVGRGQPFGRLVPQMSADMLLVGESPPWLRGEFAEGRFPGIPWFLDDQRPQGFLGRGLARHWARRLQAPPDVVMWSDTVVLAALLLRGEDMPGNFVVGVDALDRALKSGLDAIDEGSRGLRYGALAEAALSPVSPGALVAGEQPKFTASVIDAAGHIRHVIVKFSEPVDSGPMARRWADLLICEHLAGNVLSEHGHASAPSELVESQGRVCLEVTRFDRVGAYGRRGCVSLAAWSDAHDGIRDDWAAAATRMHGGNWIDEFALDQARQRWWFGRMIGNTDMHFGNLSFFLDDSLPLTLTPSYDMLPMLYKPAANGAIPVRNYTPATPSPRDMAYWHRAAIWAELYWARVAQHAGVSDAFRRIADANGAAVRAAIERFA